MQLQKYVDEVEKSLDRLPFDDIQRVVDLLVVAWENNRQVFVMGNGGSASTASHMACDLAKNTAHPEAPRLRVMSLNDNMAHFSAYANDDGYSSVFAEQLSNYVNTGDVVIAISTSGNSPNVLEAVELGRSRGAITVGWSGHAGGRLAGLVDVPVVVPSDRIEHIEDIHLMIEHMITVALRQAIHDKATQE